MGKEYLEAFETVYNTIDYLVSDVVIKDEEVNDCLTSIWEQLPTIKQALHRLESIENANPSEALKCFENMQYRISANISTIEYTTIKNALLKQQELPEPFKTGVDIGVIKQKQYLKWEELDFSYGTKVRKVRMGDTVYKVSYRCCDDIKEVQLLSEDEKLLYISFVGKYKDNVQLFNDLHLERVEE